MNPSTKQPKQGQTPLRIEVDTNGTPRMYRGSEYLGVATARELELWESRADLCEALQALVWAISTAQGQDVTKHEAFEQAQSALTRATGKE